MEARYDDWSELYMEGQMPDYIVITQNLIDAGCDMVMVERFFALQAQENTTEQLHLLSKHRRWLLENIHTEQKRLDCLDHLLYQMQKINNRALGGKR